MSAHPVERWHRVMLHLVVWLMLAGISLPIVGLALPDGTGGLRETMLRGQTNAIVGLEDALRDTLPLPHATAPAPSVPAMPAGLEEDLDQYAPPPRWEVPDTGGRLPEKLRPQGAYVRGILESAVTGPHRLHEEAVIRLRQGHYVLAKTLFFKAAEAWRKASDEVKRVRGGLGELVRDMFTPEGLVTYVTDALQRAKHEAAYARAQHQAHVLAWEARRDDPARWQDPRVKPLVREMTTLVTSQGTRFPYVHAKGGG